MTAVTTEDFNSLAAKLDGLDLTDREQLILTTVLERAAMVDEDDVSGFADSFLALLGRIKVEFPTLDVEPKDWGPSSED